MRIVRTYPPEPDPILRFLDQESIPQSVFSVPWPERAQRIRYALISICSGLHPAIAWAVAFDTTRESEAAIEEVLMQVNDSTIEDMVRQSRQRQQPGLS